jgi:hypothetical protein
MYELPASVDVFDIATRPGNGANRDHDARLEHIYCGYWQHRNVPRRLLNLSSQISIRRLKHVWA